ncbi:hypothetical protein Tco_0979781, partial [Tanacetum coccineum]
MYYLQGEVLHRTLVVKNEVMIEVGNDVVVNEVVIDMVVNEVVIDMVDEVVVMDEVSEGVRMWMVLDQQVCDRVQLVVLSLHLDPQL